MKNYTFVFSSIMVLLVVSGCIESPGDALIAKRNTEKAADNFEVNRRIVFYNTWTDTVVQQIEGLCSIEYGHRVSVICKVGVSANGDSIVKNSLISTSGQTEVIVEQLDALAVNVYHYRRTFKPQSIIPDIDFRGSSKAAISVVIPDKND